MAASAFIARLAAAAFAALCLAAPAAAQLAPGVSGHSTTREATTEEYFWSLSQLGACLAQSKTRPALAYLATAPGTAAEGAAVKRLIGHNTSCLRFVSRMPVERGVLRGVIAEAFYEDATSAPLPIASPPAPALTAMTPDDLQRLGYDGLIGRFAACVAATQPDSVHRLLAGSRLGSKDEQQAIDGMTPAFSTCLPARVKLRLDPAELRLAFAEAALKRLPKAGGD